MSMNGLLKIKTIAFSASSYEKFTSFFIFSSNDWKMTILGKIQIKAGDVKEYMEWVSKKLQI